MRTFSIITTLLIYTVTSTVYFEETFTDDALDKRWVQSKAIASFGHFELSTGKTITSKGAPKGLLTTEDDKLYAISSKFDSRFNNTDKDLIIQYSVKYEQNEECSSGKIKILNDIDQLQFIKSTKFNIAFGPNICKSYRNLEVILSYDDKPHKIHHQINIPDDFISHQYTLIIHPNETFRVLLDNIEFVSGDISTYFPTLNPKYIDDPEDPKPFDWDDKELIPDPKVERPENWNDYEQGPWEIPFISNPEYEGEWNKKIVNPDYERNGPYGHYSSSYVGFDLWQAKAGTLFYDILVTDDLNYAKSFSEKHFLPRQAEEKKQTGNIPIMQYQLNPILSL